MSLCVAAGGIVKVLAVGAFTLSWTHSVEKTQWEEDWAVGVREMNITEARVEGTGAGMEIPDGAKHDGRWYYWRPKLPPQKSITLGRSGATSDWQLCLTQGCRSIGEIVGAGDTPVRLSPCPVKPRPQD